MCSPPSLRVSPERLTLSQWPEPCGSGQRSRGAAGEAEGAFPPAEMTPCTPTVCLPRRCHPPHLLSPLSRPVSGRRLSPVARPLCAVQTTEGISDLSGPDLKLERLPVGDPAGSRQVPTGV